MISRFVLMMVMPGLVLVSAGCGGGEPTPVNKPDTPGLNKVIDPYQKAKKK